MIYELYTDGSCRKNPGPGAFACIVVDGNGDIVDTLAGSYKRTTNNRMELMAVIEGLKTLPDCCEVVVFSDSKYVVDTINKRWERRKNQDLWVQLDKELDRLSVTLQWIKGHADNAFNNAADKLAYKFAGRSEEYMEDDLGALF